jgi:hypothetical protein
VSAHPPDDGCAANVDADRAVAAALRATTTDKDDEYLIERFNHMSFCRALGCHVVNVKWVNHGVEGNTNEPVLGLSSSHLRESLRSSEWREQLVQLCDDGAPEVRTLRHCGKFTRVVWPNAHTDADVWVQQLMDDAAAHRHALDAAVKAAAEKREATREAARARALAAVKPRMCIQNLTLAVQPVHLSRTSDDVYNGVIRLFH